MLALAVAVALPLTGLVGYGVYRQFQTDRAHAVHDLKFLQQVNEDTIQRFIEGNRDRLDRLAGDPRVHSLQVNDTGRLFREIVRANPELDDLRILDTAGHILAAAQTHSPEKLREIAALPATRAAIESGKFLISSPYFSPTNSQWVCLLSLPLHDAEGNRRGTVAALIRLAEFARLLNLPDNRSDIAVGIIDEAGHIVLRRPDAERYIGAPATSFDVIHDAITRGENLIQATGLTGEERIVVLSRIDSAPWIAVTSVPTSAIYRAAWRNLWQTLIGAGVVLILGAYLISRYARMIEQPIRALADAARDQAAGQTTRLAPVTGPAEIAETARTFNEMLAARRQAEELLAQSEQRYRTVIDQTGQMIYDLELATNTIQWFGTEAAPAITGYSLAEFQSVNLQRWEEMIHPEDRSATRATLENAAKDHTGFHREYRLRHKDGTYRNIEDHGVYITDANNRAVRLLGRLSDITARRAAEQALREREERLRTIIAAEPECVKIVDPEGRLLEVNPAGLAMLEASSLEEALAQPLLHLIAPEFRAQFGALHATVIAGGTGMLEFRIIGLKGTERWAETHAVPLRNDRGEVTALLGITRDITARKHSESERARMEHKLLETQKLESLGVLAGGIAHDFNNLLTGILGNAGLARLEAPRGWNGVDYLAQIEKASLRAADLCKQMLAYSGKGRFFVQRLSLNELLEDTAQLLHISISKKATLQLALDPSLPGINADPTQIRQVVMNLVINASEALGDRTGRIILHTSHRIADASYLASTQFAGELSPGRYVCFEVSDNGMGMSRETIARIFDPFFTTKFTGRGLGLAAVLGIVRGHRGAIKVYSEPDRGTTFRVLFPAVEGDPQPLHHNRVSHSNWRGTGTVLIIDDEPAVRDVARSALTLLGFTAETAGDGAAGLALFQANPASYTAVLLDLTMPQMDGEEAFRQLRLLRPDVRVVLMSGFNRVEAINRFVGKGLAGFIQKPFEFETLAQELRRVIELPARQLD